MGIQEVLLYKKAGCILNSWLIKKEIPSSVEGVTAFQEIVRLELKNFSIYTGEQLPNTIFEFDLTKFREAVRGKEKELDELHDFEKQVDEILKNSTEPAS